MVREGRGGNAVVVFGLVSIALVSVIGATIDFTRFASARHELEARLDAALVAGARQAAGERIEAAEDAFDQMATGSITGTIQRRFEADARGLSGTVTAAVPTTLSSVIGIRAIRVTAKGHATAPAARCIEAPGERVEHETCAITVETSTLATTATQPPR